MPGPKRNRRERTDEWASIKQWTLWPEQELYEQIRPLVLFHETAGERAKEIDVPQRTLARKADEFERYGMASLFSSGEQGGARETGKTLPAEIRQLIVDLHSELPSMSWREIAEVCAQYQMWLHIDAAYGGGLALLPEHKAVTDGWAEADSLVINPHKMLFVPFDFSALYVRDIDRLRRLFTLAPEHLHLRDPAGAEINYMDYGVQLGRRFRALKAWVVWRAFGREGMAARIREHLRLAQLFARWVEQDARFEISAPVMMGVVCFRLKNSTDEAADRQNSEAVARINASGDAYLTQTKLRGRVVMRLGLGNILTTEEHVARVWEMIRAVV